jgi:hypothetical protein
VDVHGGLGPHGNLGFRLGDISHFREFNSPEIILYRTLRKAGVARTLLSACPCQRSAT